jgi:hypothetical protein
MNRTQLIKQLRAIAKDGTTDTQLGALADTIIGAKKKRDRDDSSRGLEGKITDAAKYPLELLKTLKNSESILNSFESLIQGIKEFRRESEEYTKAGYGKTFDNLKDTFKEISKESLRLTGNYQAFGKVSAALRDNFKGLDLVSEGFVETIGKAGVAMSAAGFDMQSFARIVDSSAFAFGNTQEQVEQVAATLIKASREFRVAPRELSDNFEFAQKNFAYNTKRFMQNFLELQKMSKQTGVGFSQLASSFGSSMDTFQGAATRAGRLNMILGKSVFNSIDLLGKTEAQRARVIRKGLQERFGSRISNLGKFELLAIAKELSMSPDQARRFLRGEDGAFEKSKVDRLKKIDPNKDFKKNHARLNNEIGLITKSLRNFRQPLEQTILDMSFEGRKAAKKALGLEDIIGDLRKLTQALTGQQPGPVMGGATRPMISSQKQLLAMAFIQGFKLGPKQLAILGLQKAAKVSTKIPMAGGIIGAMANNQSITDITKTIIEFLAIGEAAKVIRESDKETGSKIKPRTGLPELPKERISMILERPTSLTAKININIDGKQIEQTVIADVDYTDLNQGAQLPFV